MCFAALLNGDATRRSLREILRAELTRSVANGTVAAAIVIAVLALDGTGLALTTGLALAAVVLGTMLHQTVLLSGVLLVRGRARLRRRSSITA
jgi:Mg/Co/Ni transporter MgtE